MLELHSTIAGRGLSSLRTPISIILSYSLQSDSHLLRLPDEKARF